MTAHASIVDARGEYADSRREPHGLMAKVGEAHDVAGIGDEAAHRSGSTREDGYTYVEHLFIALQDNLTVNIQLRLDGPSSNPGGDRLSMLTSLTKRMIEKTPRA